MKNLKYPKLFEPGFIGKLQIKNRIVNGPCGTNFGGVGGEVTERLIRYYVEKAKGGVGLFIIEATVFKYPEAAGCARQLLLNHEKYISGFGALAEALHDYDAKVFLQVHHAGRQMFPFKGVQAEAPSPIPCPYLGAPVKELKGDEIWSLVEEFSETVLRAKKAGLDGVEFHGAHGYLIAEFLSPYTNKRVDEWGGPLNRRMKFLLEVIKRTREKVGWDFPLCLRFSADEFVPGGITLDESREIARAVEAAGIDVFNVSCSLDEAFYNYIEPMHYKEGWRVYLAEEIKRVVNIPVITMGQIKTPAFAEQILEKGQADFIGLVRPLIADPEWAKKAYEGRDEEIRKCISCNIGCIGRVFRDLYLTCTLNPVAGREGEVEWANLKPTDKKKKVMIVGGGPAGMEAARVAALRGHSVTLYDKNDRLGGQLLIAAVPPGKDKLNYITEYYSHQLEALKVKIELGQTVNQPLVRESKPDVVVIATGAEPLKPNIPGISSQNVFTAWDVLSGKATVPGRNTVVAGGGTVGCETALYLAKQDKRVTVVEMLDDIAMDMEAITRLEMLKVQFPRADIKTITKTKITSIIDKGVNTIDYRGRELFIGADSVVLALGSVSVKSLKNELDEFVPEIYTIGDSKKPGQIIDAIHNAYFVAHTI